MKIDFTFEEVETLKDCLIWKEIEEEAWIEKTKEAPGATAKSIFRTSCKEVEIIKAIMNKIEEARHTI